MGAPATERDRPSLDLLRNLTDRHVLEQLLGADQLTRAEIAARSGISKPTISESVRRLVDAGLVGPVGAVGGQTGKRGPAGTFYALAENVGVAFAQSVGPDGVHTELSDLRGVLVAERDHPVSSPITSGELAPIMRAETLAVMGSAPGPVRAACVSVANPVDRRAGRLVRLPDSPFLLDELNPAELLDDLLGVPIQLDNDVNWAALAEHRLGAARDLDDFVYCYLGPGLGLGLIVDGRLARGHRGLAGELAYLLTESSDRNSRPLLECFADWGLLRPGSWAIDVEKVSEMLDGDSPQSRQRADSIVTALAGALTSIVAVLNPQAVLIAQDWGWDGHLIALLSARMAVTSAIPVELRAASRLERPSLVGARAESVRAAQESLLTR